MFDLQIILIDWFFTLGTVKVPLEYSAIHLKYLIEYGWGYLMKLILILFHKFKQKFKSELNHIDKDKIFTI